MAQRRFSLRINRTVAWVLAVLALLAVGGGAVGWSSHRERSAWLANRGCDMGPLLPGVSPSSYQGAYLFPYGDVLSCRLLRREAHLFGDVAASTYLLLETEKGVVVVRVDYRDIHAGRHWKADAIELTPNQAPADLSTEDARRQREGIAARGGVRPEPWTLNYGDG